MEIFDHLDTHIVESFILGDDQTAIISFSKIFRFYHHAVYGNAFRILQDSQLAEDQVQETFLALWHKRNTLSLPFHIKTWLFKVSFNKSIDIIRKKSLTEHKELLIKTEVVFSESPEEKEASLVKLEEAIKQLSPQKKKVLELCKIKGYSYAEAAEELGISRYTVNEYLKETMAFLRGYLTNHDYLPIEILLILLSITYR